MSVSFECLFIKVGLGSDAEAEFNPYTRGLRPNNTKSVVTLPPHGGSIIAHKYLQEGIHLLLDPVDKPPLDYQAVGEKIIEICMKNKQIF